MNNSLFNPIFAQAEHWREMGRDFRVDHDKLDPTLIIVCTVVLAVVTGFLFALHRLMNRQEGQRQYNSPKQLFRSLCRLHGLTGGEKRLLMQLARGEGLGQPGMLFLAPERFDEAIAVAKSPAHKRALESVRGKLFAGLSNDASVVENGDRAKVPVASME